MQITYDIYTSIIAELASQVRYADMRAFSQTCRLLLHPCRVRLFSTIYINNNAPRFAALIKKNPTIKDYVRTLIYYPTIASEDIADALISLDNIQTLVLVGSWNWRSLTTHIQHAIIHLFSSPSITHVDIRNLVSIPAILLSSCSNLKRLELHRHALLSSEACDIILKAPPKLLSLDIPTGLVDGLLNNLRPDGLPLLDLSDLQSLSVWVQSRNHTQSVQQILRLTPDLNHLDLIVFDGFSDHELLAIALPTVRSLKIQLASSLPITLLEPWTSQPNFIGEISIILYSDSYRSLDQCWQGVDSLLSNRSIFQQLEKLSINLRWMNRDKNDLEKKKIQAQAMEFKTTIFPQLSSVSSDYLDFKISIDS